MAPDGLLLQTLPYLDGFACLLGWMLLGSDDWLQTVCVSVCLDGWLQTVCQSLIRRLLRLDDWPNTIPIPFKIHLVAQILFITITHMTRMTFQYSFKKNPVDIGSYLFFDGAISSRKVFAILSKALAFSYKTQISRFMFPAG